MEQLITDFYKLPISNDFLFKHVLLFKPICKHILEELFHTEIADAEGEAVDMAKGEVKGETKEKFATVKRMLSLGKNLQDIALCTDLPLAKVQELQAEM